MAVEKAFVKTYAEFPHLAFLHSKKGRMEARYKQALQEIDQAVALFSQQYPEATTHMNQLFWGEEKSNTFRFPIALLKNHFSFLNISTFLRQKSVKSMGHCIFSAETSIQNVLALYRTNLMSYEKWELQKVVLFEEFNDHELLQNVSVIRQFLDDIENLFGKGNLRHIIGAAEYTKYSLLAKQLSPFFTQKHIPSKEQPCSHDKIDIVTATASCHASCRNCMFQATFPLEHNEWSLVLSTEVQDHFQTIKDFYRTLEEIDVTAIPLIQFVFSLSSLLEKLSFEEYEQLQQNIRSLWDRACLGDVDIPKEPATLSVYKELKLLNIPPPPQLFSSFEWIKNIDLSAVKAFYKKQDVLEPLQSSATELLQSWRQYAEDVQTVLEEAKKHVPSRLVIRDGFILTKEEVIAMFSLIQDLKGGFGLTTIADMLRGAKTKKMRDYGLDKHNMYGAISYRKSPELKEALEFLLMEDFAVQIGYDYPKLKLTKKGNAYLSLVKNGISAAEQEHKEKEQFLQKPFAEFLADLQNPAMSDIWRREYIEQKMKENETGTYRDLVLHAASHRDCISFLEPILAAYFKEQYIPVFQIYTRTRKNSAFAKMIQSILACKETVSC